MIQAPRAIVPLSVAPRSIALRYRTLVEAGEIEADPAQCNAVERLDQLADALRERRLASKRSALGWLFTRPESGKDPRGVYLWGDVGRGKTMLMDLFFAAAPERKRRAHFHEFMIDVHARLKTARDRNERDPLGRVADAIAPTANLLCLDEFIVDDIADAMLLGRLFAQLFARSVTVVATSNTPPDDLYRDGINRSHFLPFIALLKKRLDVVELDARTDFRLEKLAGESLYLTPLDDTAACELDRLWRRMTNGLPAAAQTLIVQGRPLSVPRTAMGIARFSFEELCRRPLGPADYARLARAYHTVFIDRIPYLGDDDLNAAKRFTRLIDTLYEARVKLALSAAAPPASLYQGVARSPEAAAFARTASRLVDMQSQDYLSQWRPMA